MAAYQNSAGTAQDLTKMAESLQKKTAVYRRMDQCGWRDYDNQTENAFAQKAEQIKQQVNPFYDFQKEVAHW